jgi:hypothetical protein
MIPHMAHTGTAEVLTCKTTQGWIRNLFNPLKAARRRKKVARHPRLKKRATNPKVDVIFGLHISAQQKWKIIALKVQWLFRLVQNKNKRKASSWSEPQVYVDPIVTASQVIMGLQNHE